VTGQTGVVLQRGRRAHTYCDGTDVRHSGNVAQRKAADVAAAATIDLNVDGDLVDVTGNTGITAITLDEGREVTVRFTGTPALTHGASLVLPGAANITAAAGDVAKVRGYAAGVVRIMTWQRAAQAPIGAASDTVPGIVELATQAEQEAASDIARAVTPGRQHFHPSAPKGWCKANNNGTSDIGYNVNSITDGGTGSCTVVWETDHSSAHHCDLATPHSTAFAVGCMIGNEAAGSTAIITFVTTTGEVGDAEHIMVSSFGDQA
jgi:hypothetical protein